MLLMERLATVIHETLSHILLISSIENHVSKQCDPMGVTMSYTFRFQVFHASELFLKSKSYNGVIYFLFKFHNYRQLKRKEKTFDSGWYWNCKFVCSSSINPCC